MKVTITITNSKERELILGKTPLHIRDSLKLGIDKAMDNGLRIVKLHNRGLTLIKELIQMIKRMGLEIIDGKMELFMKDNS